MPKQVLCLLSEWGYWGEELIGPLDNLDKAGHQTRFATPKGTRAPALGVSKDAGFVDPPLGRPVVSEEMARRTTEIDASPRLDNPINLEAWIPVMPYRGTPDALRALERYNNRVDELSKEFDQWDALLIVGGSGPTMDMVNNRRVHELIMDFYRKNKPICAICYGVACLAFARNPEDRKSIIWGRHVTGHVFEYDYTDGTGFQQVYTNSKGFTSVDINIGPPPYPLEYILRDAVGPDGQFHGNYGHVLSAIVDYPFITARSTSDAYLAGELLVSVLDKGLKAYGWRGPERFGTGIGAPQLDGVEGPTPVAARS